MSAVAVVVAVAVGGALAWVVTRVIVEVAAAIGLAYQPKREAEAHADDPPAQVVWRPGPPKP